MVKFALFIVQLFKKPIQWWGVDYAQFETLLKIKLTLDSRRNPSMNKTSGKTKQTFQKQLLVFVFLGIFIGMGFFTIKDLMLNLTIIYSIIFVMLSTTLISEFTSVLFDQRDNHILLVRPISPRTLLLVRLVHIQFYMGYIALAISLFSGIFIAIKFPGFAVFGYFLGVGLCAWLALLFTIFFYLALSKVVSGERFKDFITYVQIFLAIIIFGGYQLLPRLMETDAMQQATMPILWWSYLVPPVWLAGFVKLSMFTNLTPAIYSLSFLALAVPFAGAIVVVRFLSKGFGNILSNESSESVVIIEKHTLKEKLTSKLYRFFCVSEMEIIAWKVAMKMTKRDRKFKQTVYPLFGFIPVFGIVVLKPDLNNFVASIQAMGDSNRWLFFIFLGFFGTTSIMQLPYTDTPEASWLYKALPITKHGHLITGAIKAMLLKFFLPIYLLLISIVLLIWGINILPEMILGALLTMLMALVSVIIQKMEMPFTLAREMQQKGGNVIKVFLGFFLMAAIVGLVYLSTFLNSWFVLIACISVIGIIMFTFRRMRVKKYKFE